jgi:hypothetical protein
VDLAAGVVGDDVTRGLKATHIWKKKKKITRQNYVDSPGRAILFEMGNKGPVPTQELTIGSVLSPSLTLLFCDLSLHPSCVMVMPLAHTEEPFVHNPRGR